LDPAKGDLLKEEKKTTRMRQATLQWPTDREGKENSNKNEETGEQKKPEGEDR
jgi:hypothetical protein